MSVQYSTVQDCSDCGMVTQNCCNLTFSTDKDTMEKLAQVLEDLRKGQRPMMEKMVKDKEENRKMINDLGKNLETNIWDIIAPVTARMDDTDA